MPADVLIGVYPTVSPAALWRRPGPAAFPFGEPGLVLTHLGRGALWLAFEAMGLGPGARLAMPAYHCGSEVEAARLAGLEVDFYRVDADLASDEEDLERVSARADVTYVISCFGFPPPPAPPGARLIEDAAHGLFSSGEDGSLGSRSEAAIFCPRKSLGVPDGGALLHRGPGAARARRPGPPWRVVLRSCASLTVGRAALSRLGPLRQAAARLLSATSRTDAATLQGRLTEVVIGEWCLDRDDMEAAAARPSSLTTHVLRRVDGERVRARRRRNYAALRDELWECCPPPFRKLPDGVCPLYFPVLVGDRPRVLADLLTEGVRGVEVWPVPHPLLDRHRYPELEPVRAGLLGLPVHQDLEPWHVEVVLRAAKDALSR